MLEQCENDPVKIARCFVNQSDGFAIYSDYCANYPRYGIYQLLVQYVHYSEFLLTFNRQDLTILS